MSEADSTEEYHCASERSKNKYMYSPVLLVEKHNHYNQIMLDVYSDLCKQRQRIFMFLTPDQSRNMGQNLIDYANELDKESK